MRHKPSFTIGHILIVILLTALVGHANDKPLSVRALAVDKGDFPAWYVSVGNQQFEQLQWSSRQPSLPIKTQFDQELVIYSRVLNKKGQPEFKLTKKVAIPEATDEIILLGWLTDNEDEEADEEVDEEVEGKEVHLLAIADNYKKAKFDEWLVINHCDQEVNLRFGKENDSINLEPGKSKIYPIKGERGKGSAVTAEAMIKGKMKKIYSTFWSAPDKQRAIVLFYSKNDRTRLRKIIDFLK
jgi:hypothetical protein